MGRDERRKEEEHDIQGTRVGLLVEGSKGKDGGEDETIERGRDVCLEEEIQSEGRE